MPKSLVFYLIFRNGSVKGLVTQGCFVRTERDGRINDVPPGDEERPRPEDDGSHATRVPIEDQRSRSFVPDRFPDRFRLSTGAT